MGRGKIFFPPLQFSGTDRQSCAPKTNVDTQTFHTRPIIENGQPSDTWPSLLRMPETMNFSQLLAGRMLTWAGWELSSTLQTAQLDQEKGFLKQLNRFIVQHFPSLHSIKKIIKQQNKILGFCVPWSWKVASAFFSEPPFSLACFLF